MMTTTTVLTVHAFCVIQDAMGTVLCPVNHHNLTTTTTTPPKLPLGMAYDTVLDRWEWQARACVGFSIADCLAEECLGLRLQKCHTGPRPNGSMPQLCRLSRCRPVHDATAPGVVVDTICTRQATTTTITAR
ncbi:hypothetical protein ACA910_013942 [Epithemia clementina (nom. ined.)]